MDTFGDTQGWASLGSGGAGGLAGAAALRKYSLLVRTMSGGTASAEETEATLLTAEGVSFSYPGEAKPTLGETSLQLRRGSVVGLFGQNACGKTTLARCLCDRLKPATGTVSRNTTAASGSVSASDGSTASAAGSGRREAYMLAAVAFAVAGAAVGSLWPKIPRRQQRQTVQALAQLGEIVGLSHLSAASIAAFLAFAALVFLTELVLLLSRCCGDNGSGVGSSGSGVGSTPIGVSFITSEDNPANQLPQDATLETTLTALLPASKFPDAPSKREEAIRLMETANFQRYNQTTASSPLSCLAVSLLCHGSCSCGINMCFPPHSPFQTDSLADR